jgi:predicted phosphodiesterase
MNSSAFDDLLTSAYDTVTNKPLLRNIYHEDLLVVGDIHGDLKSLDYAIKLRDELDAKTLVLLGDYVDRGSQSIECVSRVAELMINDKHSVVLRGNHEDSLIYSRFGYMDELRGINNDGKSSDRLFSKLPLALLSENYIFLHGFVDHQYKGIQTLRSLPSHMSFDTIYFGEMMNTHPELAELIWNDPNFDGQLSGKRDSLRGPGAYEIGTDITTEYLKKYDRKLVIRGHTAHGDGHRFIQENQVLSLFSAGSGYNITPQYAHIHGDNIEILTYG